jgi:hypothetical protein
VQKANAGVGLELKFRYDNNLSNLMRRSDHWPFLQHGIPALWFHTGLHPDYHTIYDRPEKINYDKMEKVARLVYQASWDLAQQAARPRLGAGTPTPTRPDCRAGGDARDARGRDGRIYGQNAQSRRWYHDCDCRDRRKTQGPAYHRSTRAAAAVSEAQWGQTLRSRHGAVFVRRSRARCQALPAPAVELCPRAAVISSIA